MAEHVPAPIPMLGNVVSEALSLITFGVLSICLTRKLQNIVQWKDSPLATYLILLIYADSCLFVLATAVIARGLGINNSHVICESGIFLCLICYMSTKILIYYFFVERAYIVRGSRMPRTKDKLYLFNVFGMIVPYCVIVILNFVFRIAYINEDGMCIIGMQKIAIIPLISIDVVVNVYLLVLFLVPLRNLYSYQNNTNKALHTMALRAFIGSCATLASTVINLVVVMILHGEPGWICFMCCNADILFTILVLHWLTAIDSNRSNSSAHSWPAGTVRDCDLTRSAHTTAGNNRVSSYFSGKQVIAKPKGKDGISAHFRPNGTITTEVVGGRVERGSEDDILEMHTIRVQKEHVQEVMEIERGTDGDSEGQSESVFGASEKTVEKMV